MWILIFAAQIKIRPLEVRSIYLISCSFVLKTRKSELIYEGHKEKVQCSTILGHDI
jgi:hypothetical protein